MYTSARPGLCCAFGATFVDGLVEVPNSIFKKPDLSIVFTLSIVTVHENDEVKRVAVFGDGVPISKEWHPDPITRGIQEPGCDCDDKETLDHSPLVREAFDAEMQRVFAQVTRKCDDLEKCFEDWNWKPPGNLSVRVGKCDVGYPGFTEARMVLIDLSRPGEDDGDDEEVEYVVDDECDEDDKR